MTLRSRRRLTLAIAAAAALAAQAACYDDPIEPPRRQIVVSGTLRNFTATAVPANARLLVVWVISDGPDTTYVYGEGTLDPDARTFRVELDAPPPAAALNPGGLGVGILIVTTNQEIREGDPLTAIPLAERIGGAGEYAVLYLDRDPAELAGAPEWVAGFREGYGVGRGIDLPGDFDGFAPYDAGSVDLIVDDWGDIEFVDWT